MNQYIGVLGRPGICDIGPGDQLLNKDWNPKYTCHHMSHGSFTSEPFRISPGRTSCSGCGCNNSCPPPSRNESGKSVGMGGSSKGSSGMGGSKSHEFYKPRSQCQGGFIKSYNSYYASKEHFGTHMNVMLHGSNPPESDDGNMF